MENRRNFLKTFGLSSAAVVGASGAIETLKLSKEDLVPAPIVAGDKEAWNPGRDVVSGCLYDRAVFDRNSLSNSYKFFNTGCTSERGPEDTNVYHAGRLDPPILFAVKKFGVTFSPGTKPEVRNAVIQRYSLRLWLGNKVYFEAPLVEAFGIENSDPTADFKTLYQVDLPVVIAYDHYFALELSSRVGLPNHPKLSMWGVLHGLQARGIQ